MPEIAWDIERIEAQAKRWQEMASVLPNDSDRVAWLIEPISTNYDPTTNDQYLRTDQHSR